eukprot:m.320715 g.320715  ORF g.320715 m.320715 type:complete len:518 (-) comp20325_c0_seq8:296-1849(-)
MILTWCLGIFLLLVVAPVRGVSRDGLLESHHVSSCVDIRTYGAVGDGVHDDTAAFNAAAEAVASTSGCVLVAGVEAGNGYVLTGTVTVGAGVSVIGTTSGFTTVPWAYAPPYDLNSTSGSRIFARPSDTAARKPLFLLEAGCSVRGLWIFYDRMPYPTDEEFQNLNSPYYYSSFEEARMRFYADHIPTLGPTFYISGGTRVLLENLAGSGFKDFIYFGPGAGQSHVQRVHGWGYGALITVEQAQDVMSFHTVRYIINAGPRVLGPKPSTGCQQNSTIERCRGNFTWIPGIVAAADENVGLWLGRSDGYVASDLFFFGVNTAIRLGFSGKFPLYNAQEQAPAPPLGPANGPWGAASLVMVDQCMRGLHFVWPNPLTNRFSDIQIHPSFGVSGRTFPAGNGTGTSLSAVNIESALLLEPTHSILNNEMLSATIMLSNFAVASFADTHNFGPIAMQVSTSNGRAFALRGDALLEVSQFSMNNVPPEYLWACAANASLSLRMRGVILSNTPVGDVTVRHLL